MIDRPKSDEYAPYYGRYISRVPDGNIIEILAAQIQATLSLLGGLDDDKALYRYEPGKWSIKQIVGHLNDVERVFCYRALAFARNDKTPLPSMEQDEYVEGSNYDAQRMADILDQFRVTRLATVSLLKSFDSDIVAREGTASGFRFTVRSIPYILAGHEIHHVGVIKERYL